MRELQISAIKNGVVIDHVPSSAAFKLVEILHLKEYEHVVTVAFNLESKSLNKKALIKISGRKLSDRELDKISVLAPNVTVNIIKDYEVVEKLKLKTPNEVMDIIKCNNYNCISNNEKIKSRFVAKNSSKKEFKCFYCERVVEQDEIEAI